MEDLLVVLVVEDDPSILSIVEAALTDGGFEPAIVSSGEQAVTLLKESASKCRALVTDIDLGRGSMHGWEVARHASSRVARVINLVNVQIYSPPPTRYARRSPGQSFEPT